MNLKSFRRHTLFPFSNNTLFLQTSTPTMSLANKGHMQNDSNMAIIQASTFYEHNFGTNSPSEIYAIDDHPKIIYQDSDSPKKATGSSESSPSSTNSSGIGYQYEGNSVISFKPQYNHQIHANGSLLSFEPNNKRVQRNLFPVNNEEYPFWEEDLHSHITTTNHIPDTSISHHTTTVYALPNDGANFAWPNDQEGGTSVIGIDQELRKREESNNKRPSTGETLQILKKQCVAGSSSATKKQPKPKCASPISKDPQSMAAKNRRERISERLKILQDLVPNGSKVDLVTMLEKAIGYVKFLQLQVKVLATDEFWPAQGGKAPDLTQVKEAIDAILASSQKDRNSSSK